VKKILIIILLTLSFINVTGQGFNYTYLDPCTRTYKTITIPSNQQGITVNYYGYTNNFNQNDFSNGNFDSWITQVSQLNSSSPCDQVTSVVQTSTNQIITQNIVSTLTSITSATATQSLNMGNFSNLGPSSNNSTGSNSSGSGGSNNSGSDNSSNSESGESSGESSGGGGTANSVSNASEGTSDSKENKDSKPRVGSLIGTGDIVVVRNTDNSKDQFRGTMSLTKTNTNNTKAKGILANFTTSINNSNITFYKAYTKKKNTLIIANSSMLDFQRNLFNTTTILESYKVKRLSLMGGLNYTIGGIGNSSFQNLSAIGGAFYLLNLNKKIQVTTLLLAVYSPYTVFYEGQWWKSSTLIVPFSSWDYALTKTFKFNISFSGTYEINQNFLNYQILTGGKILL
jgi:hypothetical protein